MEPFAIRDAIFDDLKAMLDIYNAEVVSGTATWDTEERTWEAQVAWWEAHAHAYCVIVAVEADGTWSAGGPCRASIRAPATGSRSKTPYTCGRTVSGAASGKALLSHLIDAGTGGRLPRHARQDIRR